MKRALVVVVTLLAVTALLVVQSLAQNQVYDGLVAYWDE